MFFWIWKWSAGQTRSVATPTYPLERKSLVMKAQIGKPNLAMLFSLLPELPRRQKPIKAKAVVHSDHNDGLSNRLGMLDNVVSI